MTERLQLNTPAGRWVSGSITEPRAKDIDGRDVPPEQQQYEIGLAIEKTNSALGEFFTQIQHKALSDFAQNAPVVQAIQSNGKFSWKFSDGDKPNAQGSVNQNTQGCFVFWFSTKFMDGFVLCDANNQPITSAEVKRGDYVDMAISIIGNGQVDPQRAGVYLTMHGMRRLGYGQPITGGMTIETAFGSTPAPAAPAGASTTPVGATPTMPGGAGAAAPIAPASMPGMPAAGQPAPQTVAPGNAPQTTMPGMPGVAQPAQPAAPVAPAGMLGMPGTN